MASAGVTDNLILGLVFAEAAVFYVLAAIFRRRSANVYFATWRRAVHCGSSLVTTAFPLRTTRCCMRCWAWGAWV